MSNSIGPQLTRMVMSSEASWRGCTSKRTLWAIRSPIRPRSRKVAWVRTRCPSVVTAVISVPLAPSWMVALWMRLART